LVKSDSASVRLEELDLEIPAKTGSLTTIEGLLGHIHDDLSAMQPVRKISEPEVYAKIQQILDTLQTYREGGIPFTVVVDDPAGNSYIENTQFPKEDPKLHSQRYPRTHEQNVALGLAHPDEAAPEESTTAAAQQSEAAPEQEPDVTPGEVLSFPANCSHCNAPSMTRMKMIDIPHFKEVIIMSTTCDSCGYKSNEVKSGGAVSPQGRKITLKIEDSEDLSRDILKSETCGLSIPEIDLELQPGTLGGRFTTVEGILSQVRDELYSKAPFMYGDSSSDNRRARLEAFLAKMDDVIQGRTPCTLVLDDPLANSHLQNIYAPDPDPNMTIEDYDRTWEQNEGLGLNDIDVDEQQPTANQDKPLAQDS
ncbi:nucleolar zinc-finger protein, partial [Dispira parvispora]